MVMQGSGRQFKLCSTPNMASSSSTKLEPRPFIQRFHFPNPILTALALVSLPLVSATNEGERQIKRPVLALARYNAAGLYRVPDGFLVLKQRFNAGYIVLSFVIAVVGSLCTLELLIRR